MSTSTISSTLSYRKLRRRFLQLLNERRKLEFQLTQQELYEAEDDVSSDVTNIDLVWLSNMYEKLGQEIDQTYRKLVQAMPPRKKPLVPMWN